MTQQQWHQRLTDKVDGFRTIEEALMARACYDNALSVHKAQRAIEDRRKGISQ